MSRTARALFVAISSGRRRSRSNPDAGYQTDHDARHILGCAQRSHLARGGVQDERSSQRQSEVADL